MNALHVNCDTPLFISFETIFRYPPYLCACCLFGNFFYAFTVYVLYVLNSLSSITGHRLFGVSSFIHSLHLGVFIISSLHVMQPNVIVLIGSSLPDLSIV